MGAPRSAQHPRNRVLKLGAASPALAESRSCSTVRPFGEAWTAASSSWAFAPEPVFCHGACKLGP
eukprot:3770307-Alexandrium_andersonii.AAC.1